MKIHINENIKIKKQTQKKERKRVMRPWLLFLLGWNPCLRGRRSPALGYFVKKSQQPKYSK